MATLQELLELQGGQQQQAIPTADTNRSLGEWIGDTGISALNAAIGVPKAIAGLGQILPGVNFVADPLVNWIGQGQEALYAKQSPQAQAARQEMLTAAHEGRIMDAAGSALTNPANLVDLAASGVASLGGMKLLGMGAGALAGGKNFLSPYATAFLEKSPAFKAGALEGLYTAGATANAFVDPEQLYNPGRLAAIPLGAITGAIGGASARYFPEGDIEARLLGGAAAPTIARNAVGPDDLGRTALEASPTGTLLRRMMSDPRAYVRAPMQGLREAGEEFFQSTQESMWPQAVMEGQINLDQALAEGVLGAIPGAMIGGVYGIRNAPTELPARPAQNQPVPPNAAEEAWLQEQERTLGRAIPTPEREAMLKAFRAQGYEGGTNVATGQGINVPSTAAPPLAPTTTTTYADLLANRQPASGFSSLASANDAAIAAAMQEEAIAQAQIERQRRQAELQRYGIEAEGPMRPIPAEGNRVIPSGIAQTPNRDIQRTLPSADINQALFSYLSDPALQTPENKTFLESVGVVFPEQGRPYFSDPRSGLMEQQSLPLAAATETLPYGRQQLFDQIAQARAIPAGRQYSSPLPNKPGTPEFVGPTQRSQTPQQASFSFLSNFLAAPQTINAITAMDGAQATTFLNQVHEQEVERLVASGVSQREAATHADIITGRALLEYKAKRAATVAEQKAAQAELDATQAEFDAYNAQFLALRDTGRQIGDGFTTAITDLESKAQKKGKRAEAAKAILGTDEVATGRSVADFYQNDIIPKVLPQQLQKLARLGHTIAAQTTNVATLKQQVSNLEKPVTINSAEAESVNRRIDAETVSITRAVNIARTAIKRLSAQNRGQITGVDVATRANMARQQALDSVQGFLDENELNTLLDITDEKELRKAARQIATSKIQAQEKAAKTGEAREGSDRRIRNTTDTESATNAVKAAVTELTQAIRASLPAQKISSLRNKLDAAMSQLQRAQLNAVGEKNTYLEDSVAAENISADIAKYQEQFNKATNSYDKANAKNNTALVKSLEKTRDQVLALQTGVKGTPAATAQNKPPKLTEVFARLRARENAQMEKAGRRSGYVKYNGEWITEAAAKEREAKKAGGKKVATPAPAPKPAPTPTEEEAVTPTERTPEERETLFGKARSRVDADSKKLIDTLLGVATDDAQKVLIQDTVIGTIQKLDETLKLGRRAIPLTSFVGSVGNEEKGPLATALKDAGITLSDEVKQQLWGKKKDNTVVDDKAVLDSMAKYVDRFKQTDLWANFDEAAKLRIGRKILDALGGVNYKETITEKEFKAALKKAQQKGGLGKFEIAEEDTLEDIFKKISRALGQPQPIVTDDKTVSALATLIDNPNADVEDGFLPLKKKMQELASVTKEFEDETRLTELGIALELGANEHGMQVIKIVRGKGANYTKADTDQAYVDMVTNNLDEELDSIKTILQDIYALVEGGKETINAAQAASKGATVEADFRVQTSPAIRFSIYNKLYQQDNLVPWMINDIGWRVNVNQIKQQGEENPVTSNTQLQEENAGKLTKRTQFGYIALGENVKNTTNGKKAYDETVQGARTAVRQMLPKASEEKVVELAKQHAATRLILKEIIRSNPSPFMKRLAGILERALFDTGLMYRMKISYFPHILRDQKADHAEYVFVKDGINPGVDLHEIRVYGQDLLLKTGGGKNVLINNVQARHFLHEVVHAVTAAYVTNNPTSAEAKLFQQLREIKAVNDAMANLYPKWDTYSDLRKTLEFIAAGLTDRTIADTLRGITLTSDNEHKGIFAAINTLIKEPGKALLNTYKGFVKVVRSLFGIRRQDDADLTNGFDAFLNTFTSAAQSVSKLAVENEKNTQAAYRVMSPDVSVDTRLTSPNIGETLEAEYFEQKAKEEAAIQKQIWEDKQKEKLAKPEGLRPSQERAITEGKSAAVDFARRNINSLNQRNGYDAVDKLGEFLFSWIPTSYEKYAGPDGAYLKERLHQLIDSRPTLSRVVAGLVDGYGIPHRFKINMFNKTRRLSMLNNLVGQIVNNPNLSFDEKLQQEFYDYLAGKTNTISDHILMRLAKEFKQTVDEARALGVLDDTLKNANYEDILSWNKSKMLENMRGFEFSSARRGMVNIRNGHVENGIDKFLGISVDDVGAKVNAWWRKVPDANNTGGFRVTHAFVDASKSYAQQKKLVEDTYGAGWEQAPNVWYVLSNGQSKVAYRPFTFAERKAVDKNASFIRSIAFTMYGLERKLTGIKLNDEMIAENKDLKNEEKFLFENTPENLAWLQEQLKKHGGKNRILYYEQAKLDNEQKLMRTPGNWVVLKGTRWGSLDDAKEGVSYIVPSTVFMAIEDYNNANNIIDSKTLRFINRIWKKNMTVWSTTGHTTNVLSNFIICYYNDIHPQDILKALKIIWRVKYRPKEATAEDWAFYEEAEARGAMLGTMASEELAETMENQIKELEKLELKGNSLTDYVKAATATSGIFLNYIRGIANKGDSRLSDAYANEDNVFRLAAYLSKVNQVVVAKGGAALTEAELEDIGMWASEVMINYNINAKYVKFARETVLPFIAWPYRMVGQLAKLAVEKPWKLANTLAVVYALDALAYAMLGASGDDDDEERKNLAPYMKESIWNTSVAPSYVRMPFGKLMEKGYFFGAGRIVPLGDLMVINDGMAVPQTLAAGGPVALMFQAMFNQDFFKREAIMKEGAPALDKMEDLVTFLWRGAAPAVTTRAWDAFDKVISGKQGPLGSEATSYVEIARLLGLNIREVDFAEAAYNKSIADRNALQKIKSYARQKIGQELRYPMPDMKAIQNINDNMFGALNDFWSTR